jgi:hypothetical protein
MPGYDFDRDMAELDARMRAASDFASTLMGRPYTEAHRAAREGGYELVKMDPTIKAIGADLMPRRIRCWVDDRNLIVEMQVG